MRSIVCFKSVGAYWQQLCSLDLIFNICRLFFFEDELDNLQFAAFASVGHWSTWQCCAQVSKYSDFSVLRNINDCMVVLHTIKKSTQLNCAHHRKAYAGCCLWTFNHRPLPACSHTAEPLIWRSMSTREMRWSSHTSSRAFVGCLMLCEKLP